MLKSGQRQIIYNGACPVCRADVDAVRRKASATAYVDIAQAPDILSRYGLTERDVQYRLHAVTGDGRVLRGPAAASALLKSERGWRWAGFLIDFPPFRPLAWLVYEALAAVLFRWNRRRGNF